MRFQKNWVSTAEKVVFMPKSDFILEKLDFLMIFYDFWTHFDPRKGLKSYRFWSKMIKRDSLLSYLGHLICLLVNFGSLRPFLLHFFVIFCDFLANFSYLPGQSPFCPGNFNIFEKPYPFSF